MAKAKLVQPPREVANIVMYMQGSDQPIMVRFTDAAQAKRQFELLLKASDQGKQMVLTGPTSTCVIRFPHMINAAYLVMVDDTNFLVADTNKRMQAMMNSPT